METRVSKYRKYRAELIRQDVTVIDTKAKLASTTTALPIKEVIAGLEEDSAKQNSFYRKQQYVKIIEISILALIFIGIMIALIFFGIFAFRR